MFPQATTASDGDAASGAFVRALAGGVTILQLGEQPPPASLPWVPAPNVILGRSDVWILSRELRGPRGSVFEHALRPLGGAVAGVPQPLRQHALLAGLLFMIVATGTALLLPRRRPLIAAAAMGALVLLTLGGINVWWTRQPAPPQVSGWIIVEQPPFTQVDTWIYNLPGRGTTANLPADLRPIAESIDALARLRPALRCAANGAPMGFTCEVPPGEPLAVLARDLVIGEPPTPDLQPRVTSPLLPMVKHGYLQPGARAFVVAGQVPGQPWPTVVIHAVDPRRRAATQPTG